MPIIGRQLGSILEPRNKMPEPVSPTGNLRLIELLISFQSYIHRFKSYENLLLIKRGIKVLINKKGYQ